MKKTVKLVLALLAVLTVLFCTVLPAFAAGEAEAAVQTGAVATVEDAETNEHDAKSAKAISAAIAIAITAAAGAIGMAIAIAKSVTGISRQPEAAGSIRTSLMLGLVFIETAIIYALIVAILIVFVL